MEQSRIRLSGVDLPVKKRIETALTYIFGVGLTTSQLILSSLKIDPNTRVRDLSEEEVVKLRDALREYVNEGDLRRQVHQNIDRLMKLGTYRGQRHRRKLPARGQRTKTNARTKRGKRIAIAGKKKATK